VKGFPARWQLAERHTLLNRPSKPNGGFEKKVKENKQNMKEPKKVTK
jgi:hypothetical protein